MACISYFSHHLLSTNHKSTQPYYFSHATQTYCSGAKEDLGFFDEEFQESDYPRSIACGVMESFRCYFIESIQFSLL
jgi:hypothetical protein